MLLETVHLSTSEFVLVNLFFSMYVCVCCFGAKMLKGDLLIVKVVS